MPRLPDAPTEAAYDALDRDDPVFLDAAREIAAEAGVRAGAVSRLAGGSLPVFALGGDAVLKLYPPFCAEEGRHEVRWLESLDGRLPLPTPEPRGHGLAGDWAWVVMGRLRGEPAAAHWARIPRAHRRALSRELGEALRVLHALPADPALARPAWTPFLAGQRAQAAARQARLGLDAGWVEQIPAFLDAVPLQPGAEVPLHTEIMREHVFVEERGGRFRLSGLLDFEPSMLGAREYEFASVGLFWSCGDGAMLAEVLRGYGYLESELAPPLQRRLLAWTLLHRYSHLPRDLTRLPPPEGERTLDELARRWFALGES